MVFVPSVGVRVQVFVVAGFSQGWLSNVASLLSLIWFTPDVASVAVRVNVTVWELVCLALSLI